MKYESVSEGVFLSRPNRFIAKVLVGAAEETVHVMNTGRMKELLLPGAKVWVRRSSNPERKTKFDLIGVISDHGIVNIDSMAPNKVAAEYIPRLFPDCILIKPETIFGKSRFDFYIETPAEKIFLEVKGVTLKCGAQARFPDAPTERGEKHLRELVKAKEAGFRACVLFVIAMKGCLSFAPNSETDPKFAKALFEAREAGVEVFAADCIVTEDNIAIDCEIALDF